MKLIKETNHIVIDLYEKGTLYTLKNRVDELFEKFGDLVIEEEWESHDFLKYLRVVEKREESDEEYEERLEKEKHFKINQLQEELEGTEEKLKRLNRELLQLGGTLTGRLSNE